MFDPKNELDKRFVAALENIAEKLHQLAVNTDFSLISREIHQIASAVDRNGYFQLSIPLAVNVRQVR